MYKVNTSRRPIGLLALLCVGGCQVRIDVEPDDPSFPWDGGADTAESTSDPETTAPDDPAPSTTGSASEPTSSEDTTDASESERRWGPEIIVEDTEAGASNVKVTMDALGNVLFAWRELNDAPRSAAVVTRYFSRTTGWGPIRRLAEYSGVWLRNLELCGNEDGSVALTWTTAITGSQLPASLYAAYHSPGSGLVGPVELAEAMSGQLVGCGIDSSGLAMIAWGTTAGIVFSRGEGTEWTTPEVAVEASGYYRLAMNARGYAVLGGQRGSDGAESLSAVWYDPTSGWGEPSNVPTSESVDILSFAVAVGGDDTAHIAWVVTFPDYRGEVRTSALTTDGGWTTPLRLNDDNEWGGVVTLSANEAGGALAVWTSSTPFLESRVRARRLVPGAGWEAGPHFIGEHGTMLSSTLGPNGHGLAAYRNNELMYYQGSIEIVHMPPEGPRSTFVSHIPSEDSLDPAVAVNAAGQAVVAWEHFGGPSEARALFRD